MNNPSIAGLRLSLETGETTSRSLIEQCYQTLANQAHLNAFISTDETWALSEAERLDSERKAGAVRGPLHGIPVAVKDLIDVSGTVTTCAAYPFRNNVKATDAECITRLKDAGAIIVGKTNMHELAYGATGNVSNWGPARNPWDPSKITGGSSSGSAAAVASGVVPLALGTDTGGSVRIPSAACGLVGFKPSFGSISTRGVMPLSWTLDHVGTLAHTVDDAATAAALLFQSRSGSQQVLGALKSQSVPDTPLSIGFAELSSIGLDSEVAQATELAMTKVQKAGHAVSRFPLHHHSEAHLSWLNIMLPEASSRYIDSADCNYEDFSETVRTQLEAGRFVDAMAYLKAQRFRRFFCDYFSNLFNQYDIVCLPTLPLCAPDLGQETVTIKGKTMATQDAMTAHNLIGNLLGCPAVTIPIGQNKQGLPVGMSMLKPFGQDSALIEAARQIEQVLYE